MQSGLRCLPALLLQLVVSCSSSAVPELDLRLLEAPGSACNADLHTLRQGLDTGQLWAQTMLDASVRSPVGLLWQSQVQFGHFDECLSLEPTDPVTPQYCLLHLDPRQNNFTTPDDSLFLRWGVCVPASCSAADLQDGLLAQGLSVQLPPGACTTRESETSRLTTPDIIYCLVIAIILAVVCAATAFDLLTRVYDGVSPPNSVVECLSARRGWHSLFRFDHLVPGLNLAPLYGFHSFAFFFIVLGHRFCHHFSFMIAINYPSIEKMYEGSWFNIWACHMDLFVDMFFFMSAYLLALLYYASLHTSFVSPLKVYLARYFRLAPTMAVMVFLYATVLLKLGDGPLWNIVMGGEQSFCRDQWWANLLFINTYIRPDIMCISQTWYLASDFQLFVVGTLLVLLFHKSPRAGTAVTALLAVASTAAPAIVTYTHNRRGMLTFTKDFLTDPRHHDLFNSVYSLAHYRGTSYLPGLLAGIYTFTRRDQPLPQGTTILLQITGSVISLLVYWSGSLFYDLHHQPGRLFSSLYAASFHSFFGLGMALLIISFTVGRPTPLSRLFCWRGFVPLSKLSYGVFMTHFMVQLYWVGSSKTTASCGPLELVTRAVGDVAVSLVLSLLLYLTIETPARYLVKHFTSENVNKSSTQRHDRPNKPTLKAKVFDQFINSYPTKSCDNIAVA